MTSSHPKVGPLYIMRKFNGWKSQRNNYKEKIFDWDKISKEDNFLYINFIKSGYQLKTLDHRIFLLLIVEKGCRNELPLTRNIYIWINLVVPNILPNILPT